MKDEVHHKGTEDYNFGSTTPLRLIEDPEISLTEEYPPTPEMSTALEEKHTDVAVTSATPASIHNGSVKAFTDEKAIDEALVFTAENHVDSITPEEDKKLLRKIDMNLIPLLLLTYSLKFLDQQAMSYSSNFGLLHDMNLTVSQYAWAAGSILNIAILVFQPIGNRILQIVPLGKFVASCVLIWGTLLMCTAAARSFAAIAVVRVLLGFSEASMGPAMVLIVSMWYKREGEQPGRQSAWFLGNAVAQMVGGLIGYGIGHIHSSLSVGAWIWFFIIVGAVTLCWGIVLFFILPDNPMNAKFLKPHERAMAIARVRGNQTGIINHQWKWDQFRECILDLNIWLYAALLFLSAIPSGGVASFGNIVIKQFGYSALQTTLLTIPLGAIQTVSLLSSWWACAKFKNIRCFIAALSQVPALIGAVLLTTLSKDKKVGKLIAYYIIQTHTVNDTMTYAVFSGNTSGFTKKVTGSAMMFIAGSLGLIVGPQLFKASEAPSYPTAFNAAITCFAIQIVFPFLIQANLMRLNKKKERELANLPPATEEEIAHEGLLDKTDRRQPHFRYVY